MTVTRSTPVGRAQRQVTAKPRLQETVLLLAASLTVWLALALAYEAKTAAFADIEVRLQSKQLLNLNEVRSADELLPLLDVFANAADQRFTAQKVFAYLGGANDGEGVRRSLPNIGALSRIRVEEKEIIANPQLESFARRLAQARAGDDSRRVAEMQLPLFTAAQISQLKPVFIVRTPQNFRSLFRVYALAFPVAFFIVHIVWRMRRYQGDQFILPI